MAKYKLTLVRNLSRSLRLSPREQRHLQITRLEHLVGDVEPGKKYPASFITYRLTLYAPPDNVEMCDGADLKGDLILLLDELSGTLDLPAEPLEELLTLDQIHDDYDVSKKTLAEWRAHGLITKQYVFPDGIHRSAARRTHVESFVASLGQGPIYQVRTPNERQTGLILGEAQALSKMGNVSLPEAVHRLSQKLNMPPRLIRHAIRVHDLAKPAEALFPASGVPLDPSTRQRLLTEHQAGKEEVEIAKAIGLSRQIVSEYLKTIRAEELLRTDVEYRYDPMFDTPDATEKILNAPELDRPAYKAKGATGNVPAYFADLSHLPPMDKGEEVALFRKYNFIKYQFARLRESLKPSEGENPELLAKLEQTAAQADDARKRLVEANLRLVVKLARQHAGKIVTMNDLISEGNLSLLRAVEKYDYTRGNRFSTYATWCIVKRFARVVPEENYLIETFATGSEEVIEVQPDRITTEIEHKENLAFIRSELDRVLIKLDARERDILMRRFGLANNGQPQTLEQIGDALGVTRERVRQIETRALRRVAELLKLNI